MRYLWYLVCRYLLVILTDETYTRLNRRLQFIRLGIKFYPLEKQGERKTFSKYLLELKLKGTGNLHAVVADKIQVRDYVADCIDEKHLIPVVDCFYTLKEDIFNSLPSSYIIKTNHGSGWNFIKHKEDKINIRAVFRQFKVWLSMNAYYLSRESQYRNLKPGIIIEHLIGENPKDYKIFCYQGSAKCIQVDSDRFTNHVRSFFDLEWNELPLKLRYSNIQPPPTPPTKLTEMIKIAEKLSREFEFCRVDLYQEGDSIYFGELTLNPGGGTEPFLSFDQDVLMHRIIVGE